MLFNYTAVDGSGRPAVGDIDAINVEVAINALQRRGFVLSTIAPADETTFFERDIAIWKRIGAKDIVILSRQIATLFGAQISALRIFRLLSAEIEQPLLQKVLVAIADDIQGGSALSSAFSKHPKVFSRFYLQMVRSGEESGKLDQTFNFLADYLERTYEVTVKARNALIYPIFVFITFIGVMVLMLTTVIPAVSRVFEESSQDLPFYTKAILAVSSFFVHYGWALLVLVIVGVFFLVRFIQTPRGQYEWSEFKIRFPFLGALYRKLYLSRIADNMHTMLLSAIPIVKALEITSEVVDNRLYQDAMTSAAEEVKGGSSISDALGRSPLIPGIMVQMVRVGEESGELVSILETIARFYRKEVENAIDTLMGLIEPALILVLGLGVGFLLAAVLVPIYSIAGAV